MNVEMHPTEVFILWQRLHLNLSIRLHACRWYVWERACSLLIVEAKSQALEWGITRFFLFNFQSDLRFLPCNLLEVAQWVVLHVMSCDLFVVSNARLYTHWLIQNVCWWGVLRHVDQSTLQNGRIVRFYMLLYLAFSWMSDWCLLCEYDLPKCRLRFSWRLSLMRADRPFHMLIKVDELGLMLSFQFVDHTLLLYHFIVELSDLIAIRCLNLIYSLSILRSRPWWYDEATVNIGLSKWFQNHAEAAISSMISHKLRTQWYTSGLQINFLSVHWLFNFVQNRFRALRNFVWGHPARVLLLSLEPFLDPGKVGISCWATLLTYDLQIFPSCLLCLFILLLYFFHLISELLVMLSRLWAFSLLCFLEIRSEHPVLIKLALKLFLLLLLFLFVVVKHVLETFDSLLRDL